MRKTFTAIFFNIFVILSPFASNAAPKITVSIKPIHSLVAAVTEGITAPNLLIDGTSSPHSYSLKPSDVKQLNDSDVIFLVSSDLEMFMQKSLKNLGDKATIVELIKADGVNILSSRDLNLDEEHEHEHEHDHGANDPHIWLSPENAMKMTAYIADILAKKDPENAAKYQANALAYIKEIAIKQQEIKKNLQNYKTRPYISFHDGYQYFEKEFGLNFAGAISVSSHEGLGAKRLAEIEKIAKEKNVKCLFGEPQFSSSVIEAIGKNQKIRVGSIDDMGVTSKAGKNAYLEIINNISNNMISCFDNK